MIERLYFQKIASLAAKDKRFGHYKELVDEKVHTYYQASCDELIMTQAISNAKKNNYSICKIGQAAKKRSLTRGC